MAQENNVIAPGQHDWEDTIDANNILIAPVNNIIINNDLNTTDDSTDNDTVDLMEPVDNNEPYVVILFGKTGSGKSSAVRLFCGDDIKVSGDANSTTKECKIYSETDIGSNRYWLDTQGTDDTERKESSEQILKKVFAALYKHQQTKIKPIWVVEGDATKYVCTLYNLSNY